MSFKSIEWGFIFILQANEWNDISGFKSVDIQILIWFRWYVWVISDKNTFYAILFIYHAIDKLTSNFNDRTSPS